MTTVTVQVESMFFEQVIAATVPESRLEMCIQCGTCGGSCPSADVMDHTPRQLFAMIRAGDRDEVLKSNTPWYCAACYTCMVRCPQQVRVTDLMYTLKRMSTAAGLGHDTVAPDFSRVFTQWVERSGRAFDLGVMIQHRLLHDPLGAVGLADVAVGLISKGRMSFVPESIQDVARFKRILARAKTLEVGHEA